MNNFFRKIKFRIEFGLRYKLGIFPSRALIDEYIRANGTMIGTSKSTDASYVMKDKVYNAYQRKEVLTRRVYLLDGIEYAQITVGKR